MGRLIILGGASGAGKSFLLENIASLEKSLLPVKKLTTREPRPYENSKIRSVLDLEFGFSKQEVTACEFVYRYRDDWYGTRSSDINKILSRGEHALLIVRDCSVIEQLRRTYPDCATIYLQSALSGVDLEKKLKQQGRTDIDIKERMSRIKDDFYDYVLNIKLFDYVLINYFDSDTLIGQMRSVLKHILEDEVNQTQFAFVLMPFDRTYDEVFESIVLAGENIGKEKLVIERMDQYSGDYSIPEEILRSIRRCTIIIAEVSEPNPNVFFELGYARGQNKVVIHCAKSGTKLPFDISHRRSVFYKSNIDLQKKLRDEFHQFLSGKYQFRY